MTRNSAWAPSGGFGSGNYNSLATNAPASPLPDSSESQVTPGGVALPTFIPGGSPGTAVPSTLSTALLLFGGKDHRDFLGCVNCSEYDSNSIRNKNGTYGSEYSDLSIWDHYGSYGSRYSDDSPWNPYASNPPVVVDEAGNFYGYFTVNTFNPKRTTIPSLLMLLGANTE